MADTYKDSSIKSVVRDSRGCSEKVIIKSVKSKVPRDFLYFLRNGENKTWLIDLICETISINHQKAIQLLQCSVIFFSKEDITLKIEASQVTTAADLTSNQEEADTKVILHCHHSITNTEDPIILRSPSGDTDIMVIAASLIDTPSRIFVDYSNGKTRKGVWLHQIYIATDLKKALIGFHAFTGNDYVSSLFKHGKQVCFKLMKKCVDFINAFKLSVTTGKYREKSFQIGRVCMQTVWV